MQINRSIFGQIKGWIQAMCKTLTKNAFCTIFAPLGLLQWCRYIAKLLFLNWRPQGDSNPCYRRERAKISFVKSCKTCIFMGLSYTNHMDAIKTRRCQVSKRLTLQGVWHFQKSYKWCEVFGFCTINCTIKRGLK